MDGPVFDAMLKNALEEALRQDVEEAPAVPRPSRRQRRRMKALLAAPWDHAQPSGGFEENRNIRNPARWLAAVVIAALLTGTAAAGFALGSGQWFRQKFDGSLWAGDYGGAADTEQLLDLGAEMDTTLVESGGLRLEMLDAVFDGQTVLLAVRMTVVDPALWERLQIDGSTQFPHFGQMEILSEDREDPRSFGYSCGREDGPEERRFLLEFTITDETLSAGGRYRLQLRDLVLFPPGGGDGEVLLQGEWTLTVTLRPTEVIRLEPERLCRLNGVEWMLDSVTLSPLSLQLCFHRPDGESRRRPWPYKDLVIHMKDGQTIDRQGCSAGIAASGGRVDISLEFPMPLDLSQVDYIHVCGEDIDLEE